MAQVNLPESDTSSTGPTTPPPDRSAAARVVALAVLAALSAFVVYEGQGLYREWSLLQRELSRTRATAVVGYPGIQPQITFAKYPNDWFHQEGDHFLLWGGWRQSQGHSWFRVGRGEIDLGMISLPRGRDVQRAIDRPLIETGGGTFWARVPDEAMVVGERLGGVDTAYPMVLLDKVAIVNDTVRDRPFLVTYNSFAETDEERVAVYDPVLDGRRLTMGASGYTRGRDPVLYDRGTESLWLPGPEGLRAFAGHHRGASLRQIARPSPISWYDWRSAHPRTRLIVGADRTVGRPSL